MLCSYHFEHSPLPRRDPLRLPRSQQHSLHRCGERHLTGSPLLETPDNGDFEVHVSAEVMEDTDHTPYPLLTRTQLPEETLMIRKYCYYDCHLVHFMLYNYT